MKYGMINNQCYDLRGKRLTSAKSENPIQGPYRNHSKPYKSYKNTTCTNTGPTQGSVSYYYYYYYSATSPASKDHHLILETTVATT